MATVYDITARIQKRVQVKDYQPMEAEVTMKATLEEGDDHNAVVMNLMHEAHIAVLAGLKGTPPAKPSAASKADADDEDEDETPAPKKAAKKAPAKKAAKPKPEPEPDEDDEDDEDEDEAPAPKKAPAKKSKPAPEPEDEDEDDEDDEDEDEAPAPKKPAKKSKPADDDEDEDEDDGVMDENELQKYASSLIQTRKIAVGDVKGAIAALGVTHIRNLDAKGRAKLKATLDEMAEAGEDL